jgi:hypothetical protein
MISKVTFLAGAAAGYVLGTKAGREQYEKIASLAKKTNENPKVQHALETVTAKSSEIIHEATDKAKDKISDVGDKLPGARNAADDSTAATLPGGVSPAAG